MQLRLRDSAAVSFIIRQSRLAVAMLTADKDHMSAPQLQLRPVYKSHALRPDSTHATSHVSQCYKWACMCAWAINVDSKNNILKAILKKIVTVMLPSAVTDCSEF